MTDDVCRYTRTTHSSVRSSLITAAFWITLTHHTVGCSVWTTGRFISWWQCSFNFDRLGLISAEQHFAVRTFWCRDTRNTVTYVTSLPRRRFMQLWLIYTSHTSWYFTAFHVLCIASHWILFWRCWYWLGVQGSSVSEAHQAANGADSLNDNNTNKRLHFGKWINHFSSLLTTQSTLPDSCRETQHAAGGAGATGRPTVPPEHSRRA